MATQRAGYTEFFRIPKVKIHLRVSGLKMWWKIGRYHLHKSGEHDSI